MSEAEITRRTCPRCNGKKKKPGDKYPCPNCLGRGYFEYKTLPRRRHGRGSSPLYGSKNAQRILAALKELDINWPFELKDTCIKRMMPGWNNRSAGAFLWVLDALPRINGHFHGLMPTIGSQYRVTELLKGKIGVEVSWGDWALIPKEDDFKYNQRIIWKGKLKGSITAVGDSTLTVILDGRRRKQTIFKEDTVPE